MNDQQKPLGYVLNVAANRLQNGGACEMITSERPKHPAEPFAAVEHRAVFLHPDPDAEKLRARIRVLEANQKRIADWLAKDSGADPVAVLQWLETGETDPWPDTTREKRLREELARESAKVGELQTRLDRIPRIPAVPAMSSNGILTLQLAYGAKVEVPVCALDSFETVVMGLALAINGSPMSRVSQNPVHQQAQSWFAVWDALKGLDRCRPGESAEEGAVRTIRELRSAKEDQATEIVRLRATIVDIQNAARGLPELGALLTAEKVAWAAREIRRLRAGSAAEWLDANLPDGWDCYVHPGAEPANRYRAGTGGRWYQYAPTGAEAIARLARSLGWPGPKTAPPPTAAGPVAASGATDGVAEGQGGSARCGASSRRGAFVDMAGKGHVRGTVESAQVAFEPLPPIEPGKENEPKVCEPKPTKKTAQPCRFCGKTVDDVRKLIYAPDGTTICDECTELCWELVHEKVRDPKPDNCPLPADVDGWRWTTHSEETTAGLDVWGLSVVRPNGKPMSWRVYNVGRIVASSECKTLEGGKRFAVKAARRAWRIRNGGGK